MASNPGQGALFPARDKKSPRSPDHTGSINIDGKEYFISAWNKQPKNPNGQKFLSLAVTPKQPQGPSGQNPPPGDYDNYPF